MNWNDTAAGECCRVAVAGGVAGRDVVGVPRAGGFLVYPRVRGGEVLQGGEYRVGCLGRARRGRCSPTAASGAAGVRWRRA